MICLCGTVSFVHSDDLLWFAQFQDSPSAEGPAMVSKRIGALRSRNLQHFFYKLVSISKQQIGLLNAFERTSFQK